MSTIELLRLLSSTCAAKARMLEAHLMLLFMSVEVLLLLPENFTFVRYS